MKFFTNISVSPLMTTLCLAISAATFPAVTAAQERMLEEVIVTAQKRAESSQDIPLAVSAISAETIENLGITQTQDLTKLAPSLTLAVGNSK